jgi:hypothetical protein
MKLLILSKAKKLLTMAILPALLVFWGSNASYTQEKWGMCNPVEVMNYKVRVHVKCETPLEQGIIYFAAGTDDPRFAARVLSVIGVAQIMSIPLTILYDPSDLSGASIGCLIIDCRLIRAVGFRKY